MIRYVLPNDVRHLFEENMRTHIPVPCCDTPRFVNILEQSENAYRISVYLPDGQVITGWIGKIFYPPLDLLNQDELYDGRFNA